MHTSFLTDVPCDILLSSYSAISSTSLPLTFLFFFLLLPHPPTSTLFPYTTLFRSSFHSIRSRSFRCAASRWDPPRARVGSRSEEHTSELQSRPHLVCRLLLEKKKISGWIISIRVADRRWMYGCRAATFLWLAYR